MDIIGLSGAVTPFRNIAAMGQEKDFRNAVFQWLNNERSDIPDVTLASSDTKKIQRQWNLKSDEERNILTKLFPKIDLPKDQMLQILREKRIENGLAVGLNDIVDNPYVLIEQYVGDDPDDNINFSRIDHAMFPSPDLGGEFQFETDDCQRLRA
jgi:hypothetical protein